MPDGAVGSAGATARLLRLEAGSASALIDAEHGGTLISVEVDGLELLVPGEPSPAGAIPRHGSFLLAPWVGELFEGRLPFQGHEHRLPTGGQRHAVHGLVYSGAWDVIEHSARCLALRRDLAEPWPFGGWVRQTFELQAHGLRQTAMITAGSRAMPAALGWHPWFRVSDSSTVRVHIDASRHLGLDDELIPTGATLEVAGDLDLRRGPVLGERRIDVVYVDARPPARLTLPERVVSIDWDPGIAIVVVYVDDGSVCIEPWTAWPDAPNAAARDEATGLTVLQPGETLRRWMEWAWSPG
jgi:galactose mutarotase-like enzyme